MDKLQEARTKINNIDKEIATLFEQRMECAKVVAEHKKEFGLPIFDENREKEVITNNAQYIADNEIREYYITFLKNTMNVSKDYQRRLLEGMKVAYSGVEGAFANIAAKKVFENTNLISYRDFASAYKAVENSEADVAVLPIENSVGGDVGAVMDLIFSGSLYINHIIDLDVVHNLVAKKGTKLEDIKNVYSHPQAFAQCSEFISEHKFKTIESTNTAVAAKLVSESKDKSIAAIASKETAELYGLEIIQNNINYSHNNTTRFGVFSRSLNKPKPSSKIGEHFILVFTVLNEAGSLAKALNIIGSHGFNMRNLRSRPMKELIWNYYFYVELDGNINTSDGRDLLTELKTVCDRLKLVGTYYNHKEK